MQIATLNVHGPAQVGHYNVQNIHNVFNDLIARIDKSEATDEEKEAHKQLMEMLGKPVGDLSLLRVRIKQIPN